MKESFLEFFKANWKFLISFLFLLIVSYSLYSSFVVKETSKTHKKSINKVDYSSDGSWVECIQKQLDCAYSNEGKIVEVCGEKAACDSLY